VTRSAVNRGAARRPHAVDAHTLSDAQRAAPTRYPAAARDDGFGGERNPQCLTAGGVFNSQAGVRTCHARDGTDGHHRYDGGVQRDHVSDNLPGRDGKIVPATAIGAPMAMALQSHGSDTPASQ
jgi:hypothetical protein